MRTDISELKAIINSTPASTVDTSSAATEAADAVIHQQIDQYRDLLLDNQPKTAIKLLQGLKTKIWTSASQRVCFRILTNIGAAHLYLGDTDDASNLLLEAFPYAPNDKVALANRILALRLQGNFGAARYAADEALQQYPEDSAVVSNAISTYTATEELEQFLATLPTVPLESMNVALAVSEFYRTRGMRKESRYWVEKAFEADTKEHHEVRNAYALALLSRIEENRDALIGGVLSETDRSELRQATAILQSIWDKIKETERVVAEVAVAINLANAYRFADNQIEATRVVKEGLRACPADTELRRVRAMLRFRVGDIKGTLADLNEVPWASDSALLQAYALWRDNRLDEALECIMRVIEEADDLNHRKLARILRADILTASGKLDEAEKEYTEIQAENPLDLEIPASLAQLFRKKNLPERALAVLEDALRNVEDGTGVYWRYLLAGEFQKCDAPEQAVGLLEHRIDYTRDTEPLRLLLAAALEADRRETAKTVLSQVPAALLKTPYFLRISVALSLRTGALPAALSEIEQYLKLQPDDWEMRLHWVGVAHRLGHSKEIRAFLESEPSMESATPEHRMNLAGFYNHYGFEKQAVALAYQTLQIGRAHV